MKPMDIMEALTDVDDDILLRAQLDPPKKRSTFLYGFRTAAAACLVCVVMVTALLATTIASETGLRWNVEYREDGIVWNFKDGKYINALSCSIAPTWHPEGYTLVSTTLARTFCNSYGHWYTESMMGSVYFQVTNIVDTQRIILESFPVGSYNLQTVSIGNLPGELYTYLEEPDSGELLWVDKDKYLVYRLIFRNCDRETVLKMAESVQVIQ